MKAKKLFILPLILIFLLASCSDSSSDDSSSDYSSSSPAIEAASDGDKTVLTEMNYARTDPSGYVAERLMPLKSTYTGEALTALNELIGEMNAMSALTAYKWGDGLYEAAAEWVLEQGPAGETGHDSEIWTRVKKYCSYTSAGENLSYGYNSAKDIVIQLLVDSGIPSRGHRKNILSPAFTHAGASIGTHSGYRYMCCIDFASGYSE